MSNRLLTPHPGYRVAWVALHGAGVAVCHGLGLWGWYYAAVAALEALGMARKAQGKTASGTWSWTTWRFLEDGATEGRWGFWRPWLVGAWSVWFGLGFALHGWFPWEAVNVGVGSVFLVWLWWHLFERLGRVRRAV